MLKNQLSKSLFLLTICLSVFGFSSALRTYSDKIPYRLVTGITYHKNFSNVYLDDGSIWATESYSKNDVLNWSVNDSVVLLTSGYSSYKLYNESLNQDAYVKISVPSTAGYNTCLQLISIDLTNRIFTVQDGSGMQFYFEYSSSASTYGLANWCVGDCIFMAANQPVYKFRSSYGPGSFPFTLVNMNRIDRMNVDYTLVVY
jgi:hypothetical protein